MTSAEQMGPAHSVQRTIYAARSGDGWVYLDLEQDVYSCLYQPEPDHGGSTNGAPHLFGPNLREPQAARREQEGAVKLDLKPPAPAWRDLAGAPMPSVFLLFRFLRTLPIAAWTFRGRSVRQLIQRVRMKDVRHPRSARHHEISAVVQAFETLCLFLPFRPQCLFRCYFLLQILERYGHTADWVFGVTLFPFEAHCWLAQGDVLIGEDAARAVQYEPILISPASGL
ncbi:lasso peptide biosynthesis B2 protein [Sphingomonas abietis]|uniref:Lasso peptide biosynthesis B2 protein n=1 Tax=Sphingomonas abietis TaxID=3012344 RepID=A0ABY7NSE9_9SPHN|nr:lasso peptide biosynthesis B2 protein [Sphingomonas abietis]WBO24303.1 lasso peptide biosynthesis B2 protein [Sphingomonas abietis]